MSIRIDSLEFKFSSGLRYRYFSFKINVDINKSVKHLSPDPTHQRLTGQEKQVSTHDGRFKFFLAVTPHRCQLTHHSHVRTQNFAPRHYRVSRFFDAIAYDSRYPFKNLKGFFFRNFPPLSRSTALWHHLAIAVVYVQLVFLPSWRNSPHRRKWMLSLQSSPEIV